MAKEKHQKDLIKAMRMITDSIKYHLIPWVSSKETPNEMYGGNKINIEMNLSNQLNSNKKSKVESIQDYFTGVSQFEEQL